MLPTAAMSMTERVVRLVGATALGFAADRCGPQRILIAVAVVFGVFLICAVFSTVLSHLCLFRGLGLGGVVPSPVGGLLEMANARLYPAWVSLTSPGTAAGRDAPAA